MIAALNNFYGKYEKFRSFLYWTWIENEILPLINDFDQRWQCFALYSDHHGIMIILIKQLCSAIRSTSREWCSWFLLFLCRLWFQTSCNLELICSGFLFFQEKMRFCTPHWHSSNPQAMLNRLKPQTVMENLSAFLSLKFSQPLAASHVVWHTVWMLVLTEQADVPQDFTSRMSPYLLSIAISE